MNIQNDLIVDFTNFAKSQLDDHTAQLTRQYNSKAGNTESFKLKVFNEHFHSLKNHLDKKMADLLVNATLDTTMKLKLEKIYSQYIDDFLKRDFNIKK